MTKYIRLERPDQIELAKKYKNIVDQFSIQNHALAERFRKEQQELINKLNRETKDIFTTLTAPYLADPEFAYEKATHYINMNFVHSGNAFLQENENYDGEPTSNPVFDAQCIDSDKIAQENFTASKPAPIRIN